MLKKKNKYPQGPDTEEKTELYWPRIGTFLDTDWRIRKNSANLSEYLQQIILMVCFHSSYGSYLNILKMLISYSFFSDEW